MVDLQDLKQVGKFEWEIPRSFRPDMRPGAHFCHSPAVGRDQRR
jgi:hypothetical protein